MLANTAVGLLESASIARGIEAADAMCKTASVTLARAGAIARGKYVIFITGPVAEVESSLRVGREALGPALVDEVLIRNVHGQVLRTLDVRVAVERLDALGVIETKDAIATVRAADAAAKAAAVTLIETKTSVGGGKGYVAMVGEVAAVRAAVAAGIGAVPEAAVVAHIVIPQASAQLLDSVGR
ncbi:MAG: BMC domain-containing protein [Elusimicrobia bacterium]|nr:BMC domain-containing protein [Elusimicrobiota bacterium]